ncbi:MAG: DNA alkylation repair protein [Planctomycetota bacterium]|jgi:3-methyladenine DNA glycosylase AlkD
MDVKALAAEVQRRLREAASRERCEFTQGYFPSAMRILGVATPDLRAITRGVGRRVRDAAPADMVRLAHALIAGNTLEGRQAAYELLVRHRPALASLTTREVERLGKGIDNWASVDTFACYLAGRAWREGRVSDTAVRRWARSRDRWWRRAAVVSTVPLNKPSQGGSGDPDRTLAICALVAADHDDMVAKGLSWALRELVVRDRRAVRRFLREHDAALAARVRREVRNKLRTGRKDPGR